MKYSAKDLTIDTDAFLQSVADLCNEAYQRGRADENNRVLNILHNYYEVNNAEQNAFMDMLCMEVMREQLDVYGLSSTSPLGRRGCTVTIKIADDGSLPVIALSDDYLQMLAAKLEDVEQAIRTFKEQSK